MNLNQQDFEQLKAILEIERVMSLHVNILRKMPLKINIFSGELREGAPVLDIFLEYTPLTRSCELRLNHNKLCLHPAEGIYHITLEQADELIFTCNSEYISEGFVYQRLLEPLVKERNMNLVADKFREYLVLKYASRSMSKELLDDTVNRIRNILVGTSFIKHPLNIEYYIELMENHIEDNLMY